MRVILAEVFRLLFRINFLRSKFFGVHQRLIKPLNLFQGVTRKVIYNDMQLELHIDDWIQECIFFLGDYEKAEFEILKLFLKKDNTFIDIGANIGIYTLNASGLIGENGIVISFEPFTRNHNALVNHISLNNLQNVKVEKLAVGEKNGVVNLYYDEREKNLGMVTSGPIESGITEEVKMVSLDSYLENSLIAKVDFIKIDVEGLEYSVLKGMKDTLEKYHPTLLVEISDEKGNDNHTLISGYLKGLGYRKHYISDVGKLSETDLNRDRHNYLFTITKEL